GEVPRTGAVLRGLPRPAAGGVPADRLRFRRRLGEAALVARSLRGHGGGDAGAAALARPGQYPALAPGARRAAPAPRGGPVRLSARRGRIPYWARPAPRITCAPSPACAPAPTPTPRAASPARWSGNGWPRA